MRLVLLHGLARTSLSMRGLARALSAAGHEAHAIDYPSRRASLRRLAEHVAGELSARGMSAGGSEVGFVCHSMGGVVLRALPLVMPGFGCGRIVLLGCPVQGSLLAKRFHPLPVARTVLGPVLADISPEAVASLPLPPGPFGAIAGSTWSPLMPGALFLRAWAPGRVSDSTVLVDETYSPHAADHLVLPGVHSLLPANRLVRRQVLAFLERGAFDHGAR